MNKELLFNLYSIHSESGREKKMRKYLRKKAFEFGATSVETDAHGNLLIVKGESKTYPCLAAHMDQVQRNHSKDFRVVQIGDDVLAWSPKSHEQQGLGADDKNGIFICLELLRKLDAIKVAFFVGEEVGCKGSSEVDLSFFKDCRFIIEPDRKGSSGLITSMFCGRVCSDDFIKAIGYKDYGYEEEMGSVTDVGELVERGVGISCLNLSCGYYHPHTDEEITILSDLENCLNFVEHIVTECEEVYPFEASYGRTYGYDWYDDYAYSRNGKRKAQPLWSDSRPQDDVWPVDDEDYYFEGGYYEQDRSTMLEYLKIQPDLTLRDLQTLYVCDFNAWHCFNHDATRDSVLEDMYHECMDEIEWENEWQDDIPEMEPVSKAS